VVIVDEAFVGWFLNLIENATSHTFSRTAFKSIQAITPIAVGIYDPKGFAN
jgi:L-asparaginase II